MLIKIVIGLAVGITFGYILTRTGITSYPRVMGMLRLKDFKILKFMLTAVISSLLLFHILGDIGLLKLSPKPLGWGSLIGGLMFGAGMALLGYCPGTLAARLGRGKSEAAIGLAGMVLGIFVYALMHPAIKASVLSQKMNGDLFALLNLNKWIVIIPAALVFSAVVYLLNKNFDDNKDVF